MFEACLHFTPWQTCSIEHRLHFSGKHPATLKLMHKYISLSIARYPFMQLSELGQSRVNKLA